MSRHACIAALMLAGASFALASHAHAADRYTVGQQLSPSEVQALGALPSVDIDGRKYQVLQTTQDSAGVPVTWVLTVSRAVGQTRHELLIADQPVGQVRQALSTVLARAASVKVYEHSDITLARFATLEQAMDALAQARAALPSAQVGLPITLSLPRTQ